MNTNTENQYCFLFLVIITVQGALSKEACSICGDENVEDHRSWIKCSKCSQWNHSDCAQIQDDESGEDLSYYYECDNCINKK